MLKNIVQAIVDLSRKAGKGFEGGVLIYDLVRVFDTTQNELEIV